MQGERNFWFSVLLKDTCGQEEQSIRSMGNLFYLQSHSRPKDKAWGPIAMALLK